MNTSKRTSALLGLGFLLAANGAPVWSAEMKDGGTLVEQPAATKPSYSGLFAVPEALPDVSVPASAVKLCGPRNLYSQHDVVGDPEACFMGRSGFNGSRPATGVPGL